jgi:double-strand break repair protein MRE11
VAHGQTNYIPERFISNFFNLVFWGHEHECCIDPCHNSDQQFYITQPGSSVATSLSEGESKTKHVGILTIEGKSFDVEKIRLKTVRPFIMQDIVLREIPNLDVGNVKEVEKFLKIKVSLNQ